MIRSFVVAVVSILVVASPGAAQENVPLDLGVRVGVGKGVDVGADVAVSRRVLIRFWGGPGFAFPDEGGRVPA